MARTAVAVAFLAFAAAAAASGCAFASPQYGAAIGAKIQLAFNVTLECGTFNVSYDCGENGPADDWRNVTVVPSEDCNYAFSLPCTYPYAGKYSARARIDFQPPILAECSNSTEVDVSCGADQDGLACSRANCTNDSIAQEGRCLAGSCNAQAPLGCSLPNYCKQASCGNATYWCSQNSSSGTFGWSASNSSCAMNPCPASYCSSANGTPELFSYSLQNQSCSLSSTACTASGCCMPSCAGNSCASAAGACPDVCSDLGLKISGACMGCSAAGAAGQCSYSVQPCGADTLCQQASCGGQTYYCTRDGVAFVWTTNRLRCLPGATEPPGGHPSAVPTWRPTPTPPPVQLQFPDGFAATALPTKTPIERTVVVSAEPKAIPAANIINVVGYYFEPAVIDPDAKARAFVFTDSVAPLEREIGCEGPSKCICRPPFDGSYSNFVCEMYPRVNGTYYLTIVNRANETGRFAASLEPGKKALLVKLVVSGRFGDFLYYAGIFVTFCILLYGMHHLYGVLERERRHGVTLRQQRAQLSAESERLKAAFMSGAVSEEEYKGSMIRYQKEITEANARIAEFEKSRAAQGKGRGWDD